MVEELKTNLKKQISKVKKYPIFSKFTWNNFMRFILTLFILILIPVAIVFSTLGIMILAGISWLCDRAFEKDELELLSGRSISKPETTINEENIIDL